MGSDEYAPSDLRVWRQKHKCPYSRSIANHCSLPDFSVRAYRAVFADLDVLEDNREVPDLRAFADFRGLVNKVGWLHIPS